MNKRQKKTLKISAISVGSLLTLFLVGIAIVINFVFTPAKLTPVVLDAANDNLNAHLSMESVELTFFSTFPKFGLRLKDGILVSANLEDTVTCKQDSLISFSECVITVNPLAYLFHNKISVHNISIENASVYAYRSKDGKNNWDILKQSNDSVAIDQDSVQTKFDGDIDIKNIELKHTDLVFDDRNTEVYTRMDDVNLKLKASLTKSNSSLHLRFDNKNILFWQQGELLVNKVSTSIVTDISIDRQTLIWTLKDTEVTVNGIKLIAEGKLKRDTVNKIVDMDIRYGLNAPSVETVLEMIPESVIKKDQVSADGEVNVKGTLKGMYGKEKLPAVSLKIQIKDAHAQYKGLPYGIDHLSADFESYVDLMRVNPSYADLKIFRFKGAHTDVLANARVDELLTDPKISLSTKSVIDLNALAKTFPLQEGIDITGKLNADLQLRCRLSSLMKQDIGRINLTGRLELDKFGLKGVNKDFDFTGDASLDFVGKNTLAAKAEIRHLILESKNLSTAIDKLSADVKSTNPQDTTKIVELECLLGLNKLKASVGDSIFLYSGKTNAKITLEPGKIDVSKPLIGLSMRTDSLFFRLNKTKMGMDVAGFDIHAEKVCDSIWNPDGIIGFNRLTFSTPEFGLPIRLKKTSVSLGQRSITLQNASMRIGRSNLKASGVVYNLYTSLTKNEVMKAKLNITSRLIDCNQLISALSFPEDTLRVEADTVPSDLKLFVVPKNIAFELHTDIKRVTFDKMIFEDVNGAVDIKNQTVNLQNLSMRALDADMKTAVVYRASSPKRGYVGFDFRIKDINVGKLVDFIPSLDTIVPMLRSFKGKVDFDVAAETRLDSMMNIRIPTLKAALHLRGDSLVLMDGETFAEISKMLMFKNKKQNMFDSISVNITVKDGSVTVYPFVVEIDRYKAAVGGEQGLDMSFKYHISILKSPLPFKAGVNITGNLEKMKFRIGKAKYKNAVTPAEIHKVDSTRMNMGREIINHFKRAIR